MMNLLHHEKKKIKNTISNENITRIISYQKTKLKTMSQMNKEIRTPAWIKLVKKILREKNSGQKQKEDENVPE